MSTTRKKAIAKKSAAAPKNNHKLEIEDLKATETKKNAINKKTSQSQSKKVLKDDAKSVNMKLTKPQKNKDLKVLEIAKKRTNRTVKPIEACIHHRCECSFPDRLVGVIKRIFLYSIEDPYTPLNALYNNVS